MIESIKRLCVVALWLFVLFFCWELFVADSEEWYWFPLPIAVGAVAHGIVNWIFQGIGWTIRTLSGNWTRLGR